MLIKKAHLPIYNIYSNGNIVINLEKSSMVKIRKYQRSKYINFTLQQTENIYYY